MMIVYYYLAQLDSPDQLGIPDQEFGVTQFQNIINGVYYVAGIIGILMIIIGGARMITSNANSEKMTKARNIVIYSSIGLLLVSIAFVATEFIISAAADGAKI